MAQFTSFGNFPLWFFAAQPSFDAGTFNVAASNSSTFVFDNADGSRTLFHGSGFYRTGSNIGWTSFTSAEHTSADGTIVYQSVTGFSLPSPGAGNEANPNSLYNTIMAGDDTLTGSTAGEQLQGRDGNDTLFGGVGIDSLIGGDGNDTFRYTSGTELASGEALSGGAGTDTIQLENAGDIDFRFAGFNADIEVLKFLNGTSTATFSAALVAAVGLQQVIGSAGVDALNITAANNQDLSALTFTSWTSGQDTITFTIDAGQFGTGGAEFGHITGTSQDDLFILSPGGHQGSSLHGGAGTDTVRLDAAFVEFQNFDSQSLAGIEQIVFNSGSSTLILSGAQVLASAIPTIVGSANTDALIINSNSVNNSLNANLSSLVLNSWTDGTDTITINGTGLADTITGSSHRDLINGNGGSDTLKGGGGDDVINGGAASETAVYSGAWVNYTITGAGTRTIIDTRGSSPDGTDTVSSVDNFQFSNGTFSAAQIANDAPTDIALSANSVAENAANSTVIGALSATDADSPLGDTASFTLLNDAGGRFAISGSNLVVANGSLLDFESSQSHAVTVRVTDAKGLTFDKIVTVNLADLNDTAPVITTSATPSAAENQTVVAALTSTDADTVGTNPATFTITGGADQALFDIVGTNLVFLNARDYEAQALSYTVEVTASDGLNTTAKSLTVTLADQNDNAPVITTNASQSVAENTTLVAATGSTDADTVGTNPATFSITGGVDQGLFGIVGGNLVFLAARNYETQAHSYVVQVTASDGANTTPKTITVNLTDVNEAPTSVALGATLSAIAENSSTATHIKVADIAVTDDALGTNTLGLTGADASFFEIVGSELFLKEGTTLDFEAKASYAVVVTVDDAALGLGVDATSSIYNLSVTDIAPETHTGTSGPDTLGAGKDKDFFTGGGGADIFDFDSTLESRKGALHDVIQDFVRGEDHINLHDIDAKKGHGNQDFKWIGKNQFHHKAGELHYLKKGGFLLVEGDTNGDGKADFQIEVHGAGALGKGDFVL